MFCSYHNTTQPLGSTSRDTLHLPYMALHSNEMFIWCVLNTKVVNVGQRFRWSQQLDCSTLSAAPKIAFLRPSITEVLVGILNFEISVMKFIKMFISNVTYGHVFNCCTWCWYRYFHWKMFFCHTTFIFDWIILKLTAITLMMITNTILKVWIWKLLLISIQGDEITYRYTSFQIV